MNEKLLTQTVDKFWKLLKLTSFQEKAPKKATIAMTLAKLKKKAEELGVPEQFLINYYAFFYVDVFRQTSYQQLYLKLPDFFARIESTAFKKYSYEDLELAYQVEKVWNTMNKLDMTSLPFRIKTVLRGTKINVGRDTFFEHTNNYLLFCEIAHFINIHKNLYPEIHGLEEFFLHLPIMKNYPSTYKLYYYLESNYSLEKYYNNIYNSLNKAERLRNYVKLSSINTEEYRNSAQWGAVFLSNTSIMGVM